MRRLVLLAIVGTALAAGATHVDAAPIARCPARHVDLGLATNGATGAILVSVSLWNASGHACAARGRVVFAVRDARTRRILDIVGNPHAKVVDRTIRTGETPMFTLRWSNYCGPGRPVLLEASFGAKRADQRDAYPGARCDTPASPSRLRLFHHR
jgi:hypothetical protein